MAAWQKVKDFLLLVALGLLAIFGIGWAVRRLEGSKKDHFGIDPNQPEIGNGIAGQGTAIDSNIGRVERIETILGNNADRERETSDLVEESRTARQRAAEFIKRTEE